MQLITSGAFEEIIYFDRTLVRVRNGITCNLINKFWIKSIEFHYLGSVKITASKAGDLPASPTA